MSFPDLFQNKAPRLPIIAAPLFWHRSELVLACCQSGIGTFTAKTNAR